MIRRLPPGTLRRLRIKWLALGVMLGAGSCAALAMYAAAIMPAELAYRSAARNVAPLPPAPLPASPTIELPPCAGSGKDCSEELPAPRIQRQLVPPYVGSPDTYPARTVPLPSSLPLVVLGLVALAAMRHRNQSQTNTEH